MYLKNRKINGIIGYTVNLNSNGPDSYRGLCR